MSASRDVIVRIVRGKGGRPKPIPNTFHVSKSKQRVVVWKCPVPFTVKFDRSPFYESQFDKGFNCSGLVRRGVRSNPRKRYKYSIRAWGKVTDPDGIVDR